MKLLFYSIIAIVLFANPASGQITTLGGISCGWNLTSTVTVCEGVTINANAYVSSLGTYNFSWSTSPAQYTIVQSVSSTVNSSSAKIQFNRPGIYQIFLLVSTYTPQALKSAYVIVLPRTHKTSVNSSIAQ